MACRRLSRAAPINLFPGLQRRRRARRPPNGPRMLHPVGAPGMEGATGDETAVRVLFLCTGNSCRSQMAEGWARALKGETIEPYSAGIEAHGLNPLAIRVMAEAGVDIRAQRSKTVEAVRDVSFDYVVTVCGRANETCPAWLSGKARVMHVGFDDPPSLARNAPTEEQALSPYRRVRDEIRAFIERLPGALGGPPDATPPRPGQVALDDGPPTFALRPARCPEGEALSRAVAGICVRCSRLAPGGRAGLGASCLDRRQRPELGRERCVANARGIKMVGATGFEPVTSCTPSKRASQSAPRPDEKCGKNANTRRSRGSNARPGA